MNCQDRIIGTSNKSTNPQDWITRTLKVPKIRIRTQKFAHSVQKAVYVRKSRLMRTKIHLRTQKSLNLQKPYTNLRKSRLMHKSHTQTYEKYVQPTQSHIYLRKQSAADVFLLINK